MNLFGNVLRSYSTRDITKDVAHFLKTTDTFEKLMKDVNIINVADGKCVAEFKVIREYQNMRKTLHGGFTAASVDAITTYALQSTKYAARGPSIDIHVQYLRPARENSTIIAEANIVKLGRRVGFLDIVFRSKETDRIIAFGTHTVMLDKQ